MTHRDDVAEAERYAKDFGARVWIHEADRDAARYATDLLTGEATTQIDDKLLAIPVPGHTRGSVVYLSRDNVLFAGDSLAWNKTKGDLTAFRDACWYSWSELKRSLARLADYRFEWLLPGHGNSVRLDADDMRRRVIALTARM